MLLQKKILPLKFFLHHFHNYNHTQEKKKSQERSLPTLPQNDTQNIVKCKLHFINSSLELFTCHLLKLVDEKLLKRPLLPHLHPCEHLKRMNKYVNIHLISSHASPYIIPKLIFFLLKLYYNTLLLHDSADPIYLTNMMMTKKNCVTTT